MTAKTAKVAAKKRMAERIEFDVEFGNLSIGDKTAKLAVSIARPKLNPTKADKLLCDQRLIGRIEARPADEQEGQGHFDGMAPDLALDGIFDVKGFRASSKLIAFGLTFTLKNLDVAKLSHFPKLPGKLIVESQEEIPEEEILTIPDPEANGQED